MNLDITLLRPLKIEHFYELKTLNFIIENL